MNINNQNYICNVVKQDFQLRTIQMETMSRWREVSRHGDISKRSKTGFVTRSLEMPPIRRRFMVLSSSYLRTENA